MIIFNILATPSLLCGYEISALRERDIRRLNTAEMKLVRHAAGYNLLDHRGNKNTLEKLTIDPIDKKVVSCTI